MVAAGATLASGVFAEVEDRLPMPSSSGTG
jgi:hypothetical protein